MNYVGRLFSIGTWLLVCGSVVVLVGGLFGRPLLLAAVPTGSMVPALSPGDMIVVLPNWAVTQPGLSDIVIFKSRENENWVVHRIIDGNSAEGFVTQGDANPTPDSGRILHRDVVGVVPQVNGKPLRLPRLGLLSVAEGPLSSPVVAGVALAMGVYLLVLDVRPSFRMPRLKLVQKSHAHPSALLSMYLGLAATAFITTLLPAWTLSSKQQVRYEVVEQIDTRAFRDTEKLLGQDYSESVPVRNQSPLPLITVFVADDPNISYSPAWVVAPPRSEVPVIVKLATPQAGKFVSEVRTGVFLPLLPGPLLAWLAGRSIALAVVVTALVPALLLLSLTLMDYRARLALGRIRTKWLVRFL